MRKCSDWSNKYVAGVADSEPELKLLVTLAASSHCASHSLGAASHTPSPLSQCVSELGCGVK